MTFTAQDFNTRAAFQEQTAETDEAGQLLDVWTTYAEAFVRFEPLLGREYFAAAGPANQAKAKITMRWRNDIRHMHRVIVRGKAWQIEDAQNIAYRNRELLLYVSRTE